MSDTLTAALAEPALAAAAADWRTVAFAAGPTDRAEAERLAGVVYDLAVPGHAGDYEIVWCSSPASAAHLIAQDPERFGRPLRHQIRDVPWERARAALVAELGMPGYAAAWRTACGTLAPAVSQLTGRVAAEIETQSDPDGRAALRVALTHALHGQHDAAWLPLFEAAGQTSDLPAVDETGVLAAIGRLSRHVGWWWPFEKAIILTDRPVALHRDESGRLHSGGAPALAYPDGFALHAWHGQRLTPEFSAAMAAPTAELIRTESNVELRRMLLEHFTYERFIADSGATPVHEDETGRLWRIQLPNDEDVLLVEVVNATAEPDGEFRTYWLRVPPATGTAKAGVAWTFGMTEAEYTPLIQT